MSIMRVRFIITGLNGLPGLHTTYWNGALAAPVQADAQDVVDRVRAFWQALNSTMADGVTISPDGTVDVLAESTGALTGSFSATAASVSSIGTGAAPLASMMLLKYFTAAIVNGRKLQGRSFIGPVESTAISSGQVSSTANTSLITAAGSLSTGGSTASEQVVWHRPTLAAPSGGSTSVVTGFGTDIDFAVLRSRRD